MTTDQELMFNLIPENGRAIGNKTMRELLKWDEEKYWRIRDELFYGGHIRKAQGKGGAVARVEVKEDEKPKTLASEKKETYKDEKSIYKDFLQTIESKYTKDMGIKNFVCEDTSSQGRRDTHGLWTRPDITLIAVNTYSYYPGKVMDVITFEIKHHKNISIAGVFETASQSRYATKSYFCLYLPSGLSDKEEGYERIQNECERFGVGLMYFTDPKNYDTFEILVKPNRNEPDPAEINDFIVLQINDKNKNKLAEMLR